MENIFNNLEGLENFTREKSYDISPNTTYELYRNFINSEENIRKYGETFSDFYYITCPPFEGSIQQRKNMSEIYEILKRSVHMANGHPLEILIGKYSDESMDRARKITEERRKEYEGMGLVVGDPKSFIYMVGFFGGTTGRTNQAIIREIREMFPDKVKFIKTGI